jgi:hypothetical protein
VGFLVNSLFHETKIPTVDMKVQVNSKFEKTLFWKKVQSPLSMNFGRISTSKCRGKLQKMGVLYTHSPKSLGPFPKLPKIHFFKFKKIQRNWDSLTSAGVDPRPVGDRWSPAGPGPPTYGRQPLATGDQRSGHGHPATTGP